MAAMTSGENPVIGRPYPSEYERNIHYMFSPAKHIKRNILRERKSCPVLVILNLWTAAMARNEIKV